MLLNNEGVKNIDDKSTILTVLAAQKCNILAFCQDKKSGLFLSPPQVAVQADLRRWADARSM